MKLTPDTLHLWFAYPDEITDPHLLSEYGLWLSADEQAQQRRFRFAEHRHQFLVTRALVRYTLSQYADVAPQAWRFERNAQGKPEIAEGLTDLPLRFNLSHTKGLILCGVVLQHDLGVDVEDLERRAATLKIAEHFFSAQEINALCKLPPNAQNGRFFDYWTLKEAYIKARGLGLSLPLDQFSFHIDDGLPLSVSFAEHLAERPQNWQFWRIKPAGSYVGAVAVKSAGQIVAEPTSFKVIPLVNTTAYKCRFL